MEYIRTRLSQIKCFAKELWKIAKNIFGEQTICKREYKSLAPINDVEDCEEHINALSWAVEQLDIKNIAITGPFGSGKSSVINTFLERNPFLKERSIRISLATFAEKKEKTDFNLQEEVLKQLFYKVKQSKIPQSRYRKLKKIKFWPIFSVLGFFTAIALATIYIFKPELFIEYKALILNAGMNLNMSGRVAALAFSAGILSTVLIVAKLMQRFACRISINEIKLPINTTIKRGKASREEIFNSRIDEIVYFFEVTNYNLVFIEDLDRFDNELIFIQLRELNTLLNNYDAINRKIVFVYAIKDDMFDGGERTKFFDFIIPVIPVINSTNSDEILLELIREGENSGFKHDLSEHYILDVSTYISDMRVLQNIYNEFVIYKETLKKQQGLTTLLDELMMSLIIFKNLYPKAFADLQDEKGLVKLAFENKKDFVEAKTTELKEDRIKIVNDLHNISEDILVDAREVKFAMLCALTDWNGVAKEVRRSGNGSYSAERILRDDFDMQNLLENGTWYVDGASITRTSISSRTTDVVAICEPYVERLQYMQYVEEEKQQEFKKKLAELDADINNISALNLKQLIALYGSTNVLKSKAVKENDLLVFMLRKGYIDENYADYMNYFKGNSITVNDMKFIHSVKNQKPEAFDYHLSENKMEQIIRRLQDHEFSERATLNFDLMEYMLSVTNHDTKLNVYIEQLTDGSEKSWKYINEFISKTNYKERFIKLLASKWDGFWNDIYDSHTFDYDTKLKYLERICLYCNLEVLVALNKSGKIEQFFVEHDDILQKLPENVIDSVKRVIAELNICFRKINVEGVSPIILDFIFDNNYYDLNSEMIKSVVEYKNPSQEEFLSTKNYTTVRDLGYKTLLDYIVENIEAYIDNVVLKDTNICEDVEAILEILTYILKDTTRCEDIISHEQFLVEEISVVYPDYIESEKNDVHNVWNLMLKYNRVKVSWENIYEYWKNFGITEILTTYICDHSKILKAEDISILDDDFKSGIICSKLEEDVFEKLAKYFKLDKFEISLDEIDENRLKTLICHHYFEFDVSSYKDIETHYPDLRKEFILQNQDEFLKCMDELSIQNSMIQDLIMDKRTAPFTKETLIMYKSDEVITEEIAISIIETNTRINSELFDIMWDKLTTIEKKKELLFKNLELLDASDFAKYLMDLDKPYCDMKREFGRHDVFLPETQLNLALAKRLKAVMYITSYEVEVRSFGPKRKRVIRCRIKASNA